MIVLYCILIYMSQSWKLNAYTDGANGTELEYAEQRDCEKYHLSSSYKSLTWKKVILSNNTTNKTNNNRQIDTQALNSRFCHNHRFSSMFTALLPQVVRRAISDATCAIVCCCQSKRGVRHSGMCKHNTSLWDVQLHTAAYSVMMSLLWKLF